MVKSSVWCPHHQPFAFHSWTKVSSIGVLMSTRIFTLRHHLFLWPSFWSCSSGGCQVVSEVFVFWVVSSLNHETLFRGNIGQLFELLTFLRLPAQLIFSTQCCAFHFGHKYSLIGCIRILVVLFFPLYFPLFLQSESKYSDCLIINTSQSRSDTYYIYRMVL